MMTTTKILMQGQKILMKTTTKEEQPALVHCHKATKQTKHRFQSKKKEMKTSVPSRLQPNVCDETISVSFSISVAFHTPELLTCCRQRFPSMSAVLRLRQLVCPCFPILFVAVPATYQAPPQLFSRHMIEMSLCPTLSRSISHNRRCSRKKRSR